MRTRSKRPSRRRFHTVPSEHPRTTAASATVRLGRSGGAAGGGILRGLEDVVGQVFFAAVAAPRVLVATVGSVSGGAPRKRAANPRRINRRTEKRAAPPGHPRLAFIADVKCAGNAPGRIFGVRSSTDFLC